MAWLSAFASSPHKTTPVRYMIFAETGLMIAKHQNDRILIHLRKYSTSISNARSVSCTRAKYSSSSDVRRFVLLGSTVTSTYRRLVRAYFRGSASSH